MMRRVCTVGQINRYIRGLFAGDALLAAVSVRGEVSNVKYHTSGHIYFSLKDETGALQCVMFRGRRSGLAFSMRDGDKVVVHGSVEVYERDGKYQLYANEIRREGEGALYERVAALKKKLEAEGLFLPERKKQIPRYAATVGVVTAQTGAAIHDIENISRRRNPHVQLILCPALVQGEGAADSIVRGIRTLDGLVDILIVGRGGGSLEDLMAFNEESVVRAIAECGTPVISAVGHETDTTLADYAADLRAPTPSAAAELAVFDCAECEAYLARHGMNMKRIVGARLDAMRKEAHWFGVRMGALSPARKLRDGRLRADAVQDAMTAALSEKVRAGLDRAERLSGRFAPPLSARLAALRALEAEDGRRIRLATWDHLRAAETRLKVTAASLDGLSPLKRLSQGYAYLADPEGGAIRSVKQVSPGDRLTAHLADGTVPLRVQGEIHAGKKE